MRQLEVASFGKRPPKLIVYGTNPKSHAKTFRNEKPVLVHIFLKGGRLVG